MAEQVGIQAQLPALLVSVRRGLPWFMFSYWLIFTLCGYFEVDAFTDPQDLVCLFFLAGCIYAVGASLGYMRSSERPGWKLIWYSFFPHLVGDGLWYYHELVYDTAPTVPSSCDLFYFLDTMLLIAGMLLYLRNIGRLQLRFLSIDLFITTLVMAGLIYYLQIAPRWEQDHSTFTILVMVMYPFFDLLMICFLLYLFLTSYRAMLNRRDVYLALAFLFVCLGDELDLANSLYELNLDWMVNPIWIQPYFFFVLSALQPDPKRNFAVRREHPKGVGYKLLDMLRISLPFLGTITILALGVVKYRLDDPLFFWGILLVSLLSFRQILVIMYNRELLDDLSRTDARLNQQNLELQKLNDQISKDAKTDYLTGLYNRRYFDLVFSELVGPGTTSKSAAVFIIDVDKFKQVNDTFGHQIGDLTLSLIAKLIRLEIGDQGCACRYGGDEFIVLLKNLSPAEAEQCAARLLERVREHQSLCAYRITLSIGVATFCPGDERSCSLKLLLRGADSALYEAKEKGRDQYRCYLPASES